MPKLIDWNATDAVTGKKFTRQEYIGTSNLPLDRVNKMSVATDHPAAPIIKVTCSPELDERVRVFTRRTLPVSFSGTPTGAETTDVVVIEIANAVSPGKFVRLYLRSDGIVLSSEDLNG